MRTRQTWALVGKDLRLHGAGMAATVAGGLGILWVAGLLKPNAGESAATGLILSLNVIMVLIWSDWLVSREKTKGTIAWLRTLPVPDHTIIMAKTATYMIACVWLWTATTLVYVPHYFFPARWREWVAVQSLLVLIGTAAVCGRFRFRQKLGQVLPLLALGVPLWLHLLLRRLAPAAAARLDGLVMRPSMVVAGAAALFATSGLIIWATAAWMRRAETFELTE